MIAHPLFRSLQRYANEFPDCPPRTGQIRIPNHHPESLIRCFLDVDLNFVFRLDSFFPGTGASSQGVLRFLVVETALQGDEQGELCVRKGVKSRAKQVLRIKSKPH